jgi:hypothetical protein
MQLYILRHATAIPRGTPGYPAESGRQGTSQESTGSEWVFNPKYIIF